MRYAVLLKGINVGGKNIVKMAELKMLLSCLGLENIRTYIQSGNAVFDTEEASEQVKKRLREAFAKAFGFRSSMVFRTVEEFVAIMQGLPFSEQEMEKAMRAKPEVDHLYVCLSDEELERREVERIAGAYDGPDRMEMGANEIYLLCRGSIRDSKLAAAITGLNTSITVRNWKTMRKLFDMMDT